MLLTLPAAQIPPFKPSPHIFLLFAFLSYSYRYVTAGPFLPGQPALEQGRHIN
jgi:hypothetical protein